jgi:hypothetical protein
VLEAPRFANEYQVLRNTDVRTKAHRDEVEELRAAGYSHFLNVRDYERVLAIAEQIRVARIINYACTEVSVFADLYGFACKGRFDGLYEGNDGALDLKTSAAATKFDPEGKRFFQAAFYAALYHAASGRKLESYGMVHVTIDAPYPIVCRELSRKVLYSRSAQRIIEDALLATRVPPPVKGQLNVPVKDLNEDGLAETLYSFNFYKDTQ